MRPTTQRLLIAATQVLALAVWFSVSAVVPSLRHDLSFSDAAAVWLTGTVQLGFVTGALTATVLNLSDRMRPNVLLGISAVLAAACTAAVAQLTDGFTAILVLRFLTGVFLAGVYPTGMKLMASWAPSAGRGAWMGVLIGALTLGSALPHLIGGLVALPWRGVLLATAGIGIVGALLAFGLVRSGPHLASGPVRLHPRYALSMFAERGPRLVNLGYFGHMWELYALWTWIPVFVLHAPAVGEFNGREQVVVFIAMGVLGFAGCVAGGLAADRFGRARAAGTALAVSGTCCALSPLAFTAPAPVLAVFCGVWGASVIADSGVFSTALSEVADRRFVGTALSAQTAIGFGLTVASIQFVAVLAAFTGWQYAFLLLVPGPLVGTIAMARFAKVAATRPAGP
ncbi:MFS transporter [Glycomyces sp. NPDC048151]|uniref:MFS transporter n=1 Tax=Glycomyces sp. NPDC048151 TaxID=3364002 RepID=UPI0037122AA1